MLEHPAATEAFTSETLDKLHSLLQSEQVMDTSHFLIEKARSIEKQVYHPLLRTFRRHIMNKHGVLLSYEIKGGRMIHDQLALPSKLEYSMVKREWYLLWYHLKRKTFMSTRLKNIISVSPETIELSDVDHLLSRIAQILDSRKTSAVLEVVPAYNRELSRILYALSSFEKDVAYNEENDIYTVTVYLLGGESEYLLSKLRFLGKRVRVIEGKYLKKRMLEASTKALERYGAIPSKEGE
ncbi:hypothetical protein D3C81_1594710 [compost metagenome]